MDSDEIRRSHWLLRIAGSGLLAMLLEPLSIGPVAAFVKWAGLPVEPVRIVSTPRVWLHDITLLKKPLEDDLLLWGVP